MSLLRQKAAGQLGRPLAGLARQTAQPVVASRPIPASRRGRATAVDPADPAATGVAAPSSSSIPFTPTATTSLPPTEGAVRHNWSRKEVQQIYDSPLLELVFRSANVHRSHHPVNRVQLCTLMNIKEGGCSEDCGYCSQSSKYETPSNASKLEDLETVLTEARKAKANGSTRFCMGAAWREVGGRKRGFNRILDMVREIRGMGMEVCTTLGMLTTEQAKQLKEAGLTAYNHNLDTSREYYGKVVTTRSYDDRIGTIANVREAGISVCSGGILGLGEEHEDRVGLIWEMSTLPEHPESFPVNALVAIPGTPMEQNEPISFQDMLRTVATARIVLPGSIIRLAAGRHLFTESEQAMAFLAGANAIFTGERMLTTPTSSWDDDKAMLGRWGLRGMESFEDKTMAPHGHAAATGETVSIEDRRAKAAASQAFQAA
ncbi:Biotin and thiamine synthesis-associated domain protein [Kalmanozyma brasiliensis GHG001]|uniref:biotin synthase n=1 Tax=Kalmanozyma brasiliensis (strain GHG001) TaxID=1365824 RepID=V5EH75_KALBG|nr:Biotin and thiamine synthesis-associated domain protein [Kalmanozyma brasiliensis GHG001]EST09931.1 Biotin and thiamine synthesis-associated domain protein [Kalmanozyma brasiliensis GHG001]